MTFEEVIAWAETKSCSARRRTGTCEHEACAENARAITVLRTAVRFAGTDEDGESVSGWLIPE